MASALRLCAQASAGKAACLAARAAPEAPGPSAGAARGPLPAAPLSRRSAFAGATLWWAGVGEPKPSGLPSLEWAGRPRRRFGGRPGVIIGLDFMPAPAQGPTGPLLVAALAVPIVAVGLRVLLQALAKSGSSSVGIGTQLAPAEAPEGLEIATFAGGCFWGLELAFQRAIGVTKTMAGYTQGTVPNPSYEEVCTGRTGHTEAVQVYFDPTETTYKALLDVFYAHTDPTQLNQQGNDRGTQYRSGLYYHGDQQKAEALASLAEAQAALDAGTARIARGGNKVVVEVLPASDYYIAEGYHQQYLAKGGRFNRPQSAEKGNTDPIRCYG